MPKASISELSMVATEAISSRAVVRYSTISNQVELAIADGTKKRSAGFSVHDSTIGEEIVVQTRDTLNGFLGLVSGSVYYLSQITPGDITAVRPTSGEIQIVGLAKSATELDIRIQFEEGTFNEILLKDQVTGIVYKLCVSNGTLQLI